MRTYAFGIDLGTSTSVISYVVDGKPVVIPDPHTKSPLVPSIVGIDRKGQLVTGQDALDESLPEHLIREAKRLMGTDEKTKIGDYELRPEEVGALILKKMKDNAEISLGSEVKSPVITVPAYFDDLPRRATEKAGQLASLPPLRLISEPVAAALAYGINRQEEEGILLVFDFGGGTLDVTVIDMIAGILEVKATHGDKALGGKDMDEALLRFISEKVGHKLPAPRTKSWEPLRVEVERVKIKLTSSESVNFYVPAIESDGQLVDWEVEVTLAELNKVIDPFIDRAIARIDDAIEKAGLELSEISKLLLVGGTCYIPHVRNRVENHLKLKSEKGVDPDLAVSMGAAISAGLKTGEIDAATSVVVQDAATYRMGITSASLVGEQMMLTFSELMPANVSIPFVRTERFHMLTLDQDQVEVTVQQDRSGKAVLAADAIDTGACGLITDIPPSTTGIPHAVDVEFRFDESQIIRVTAKVVGIDKSVTLQLNSEQVGDDPITALSGSTIVDSMWETSPLAKRNSALIRRCESVLESSPANGEILEAALTDLKEAVASNDKDRAQQSREKLSDILAEM